MGTRRRAAPRRARTGVGCGGWRSSGSSRSCWPSRPSRRPTPRSSATPNSSRTCGPSRSTRPRSATAPARSPGSSRTGSATRSRARAPRLPNDVTEMRNDGVAVSFPTPDDQPARRAAPLHLLHRHRRCLHLLHRPPDQGPDERDHVDRALQGQDLQQRPPLHHVRGRGRVTPASSRRSARSSTS